MGGVRGRVWGVAHPTRRAAPRAGAPSKSGPAGRPRAPHRASFSGGSCSTGASTSSSRQVRPSSVPSMRRVLETCGRGAGGPWG
jgi:hypothetical protein